MAADASPLKGLNLQQLAQVQYGAQAQVVQTGEGLYDWRARVNGKLVELDFANTYRKLNGQQHFVIATGVHARDWKALDSTEIAQRYYCVPILVLPEELRTNIPVVESAVKAIGDLLSSMQDFYRHYSGRTFRFIPAVIQPSHMTSAFINGTALQGADALLNLARNEFHRAGDLRRFVDQGTITPPVTVMAFFKTVGVQATGNGGRGDGAKFAVMPPSVLEHPFSDWRQIKTPEEDGTAFVLYHEGGHALGMPHTCDGFNGQEAVACKADARNAKSVMRGDAQCWVKRDSANLGPGDAAYIQRNPRFFPA